MRGFSYTTLWRYALAERQKHLVHVWNARNRLGMTLQLVGALGQTRTYQTVALRLYWSVDGGVEQPGVTVPKHHSALTIRNLKAPPTTKLARGLANLKNWDHEALCKEWQRLFRKKVLLNLPQYILVRMIAYQIQANAFGDLDANCIKYLNQVAAQRATRLASKNKRPHKSPPPIPAVPAEQSLKTGSILIREHDGHLHKVIVAAPRRFRWNDTIFKSFSEVAYAITGTRWNGPRFFGLRSGPLIRNSPADEHSL